jgi:hypothetical protein
MRALLRMPSRRSRTSKCLCGIGLLALFAARSWACACVGVWPSAKQAWAASPVVFVGTVEFASSDGTDRELMFQEQFVRLHVDEAFKGVSEGQTIYLHQGATDCDAKFRTGQRAVFYLQHGRETATWIVPACTRAVESAEPGGDDLLFLKRLPQSALGTRLSGEVELYESSPTDSFRRVRGISDVRVKISGPQGFRREILTNGAGAYEVYGLGPGIYSVSIEVPHGLRVKFPLTTGSPPVPKDQAAVKLEPNGGVSVGFVLQADTKVSGRMLDAKGAPAKSICLDLEPVSGRSDEGASFFTCSKANGSFEMEMMPPGDYWLVAKDEVRFGRSLSKSTLYYPGVRQKDRAKVVTVRTSNYTSNLDIRLPAGEKRYTIAGRMQFADGAPAAHAGITFTSPEHGYSETAGTDTDGTFSLSVIAGVDGEVTGSLGVLEAALRGCPQYQAASRKRGLFRIIDATPVPLRVASDSTGIVLELPTGSCATSGRPPDKK